jgi:hypothetical protein
MNLFYLHENLEICAKMHIDKHLGKMILEAAQLMCNAYHVCKYVGYVPRKLTKEELYIADSFLNDYYRPIALNHPCSIWVRTSFENYSWTGKYAFALFKEFGKPHKSMEVIFNLPVPRNLKHIGLTPHALAMPEEYKSNNIIESYRHYYIVEKLPLGKYNEDIWLQNV